MVTIPLGNIDWQSPDQNIPELKLHNMYLAENPASPDGLSRVSRPTLNFEVIVGTGPIYGIWQQDGCFAGDWLVVSGTTLYRVNRVTKVVTTIGEVGTVGYCQFAGTSDRAIIVRNGIAYSTDGVALTSIEFPDDIPGAPAVPLIQSVAVINSYFIVTIKGTQRFYWIAPGEVNPDPLNFASAERLPDNIEAVAIVSDEIWFIGSQGPEVWAPTTDVDLPFQRINGRVYSDGTISRDSVVNAVSGSQPCLIWCTPEGSVVMAQGGVRRIANESVEEALKGAINPRAWVFRTNRHDFYVLTTNKFTYVYDITRGEWSRWDTYEQDVWYAHLGLQDRGVPYAGSSVDGKIYRLVEGTDDDGLSVVREVSGLVVNPGKPLQCSSVLAVVNSGWSASYDYEPRLELRWSDDFGATWSEYVYLGLGVKGQYWKSAIFRSLGLIPQGSRIFEFRFAEKARFRIDYANMNEV